MKIWRYTRLDATLLVLSVAQFVTTLILAVYWEDFSSFGKLGSFALLVFMMTYNIIVVSHLFTHAPWFESPWLNGLVSMLNSINIGQSVQVYQLKHVHNHHRYGNDQKDMNGKTKDWSSTFQDGKDNEHATLFRYAFLGAFATLLNVGRELCFVFRPRHIGSDDLLELVAKSADRRASEVNQIRLDRIVHLLGLCLFLTISWQWTLTCYLPAFYLALALVNIQNYYEHYGAIPDSKIANSVSYYGRLYNLFAFNDGYHQEHHLRPGAHWSAMPEVRHTYRNELDQAERIVSPVPAILGFFHRKRELLHHQ